MPSLLWIVIVLVVLFALIPAWPYNANWSYGYYPAGGVGLILVILIILLLLGRL